VPANPNPAGTMAIKPERESCQYALLLVEKSLPYLTIRRRHFVA